MYGRSRRAGYLVYIVIKFKLKQELNPGSVADFEVDSEGRFTRCVIVPHGCAVAAAMTPKRVMFGDGFFLKGEFAGTGLVFTMLSAENELVCVALVICGGENASNYQYGLDAMKRHVTLGSAMTKEVREHWNDRQSAEICFPLGALALSAGSTNGR
jgi:hypothetical protein